MMLSLPCPFGTCTSSLIRIHGRQQTQPRSLRVCQYPFVQREDEALVRSREQWHGCMWKVSLCHRSVSFWYVPVSYLAVDCPPPTRHLRCDHLLRWGLSGGTAVKIGSSHKSSRGSTATEYDRLIVVVFLYCTHTAGLLIS